MIFESSMQLWITHNGEREKLRFPVLPTKFDVTHETKNTSVTISGLGEILILQDRAAVEVSWDSFSRPRIFRASRRHSCCRRRTR